jgi:hypothetical protein
VADEAREVSPFQLNKNVRSTAPPADDKTKEIDEDKARPVAPIIFTRPGEDFYTSDDPDAAPVYSDFRAAILPADSDVPIPGEDELPPELIEEAAEEDEDEDPPVDPKDSSAPASVISLPPSPTEPPVPTVQPDELSNPLTAALASLDAVKDNGQLSPSESSSPTSSSTQEPKPGKSEPPASA